jgi:hypothetical protein
MEGGGLIDDARYHGMQSPSHYNPIPIEKIKDRSPNWKIIKPMKEEAKVI